MAKQHYIPLFAVVEEGKVKVFLDQDEVFPTNWTWDTDDETWGGFPFDPQDQDDREQIVAALRAALTELEA